MTTEKDAVKLYRSGAIPESVRSRMFYESITLRFMGDGRTELFSKIDKDIKIIEEKLSPYGFKYVKYQDFRWQFRRELEEGWQEIVIQKDIWGGKSYRPEIRSSVQTGVLRLPGWSEELRYCSDALEHRNEEEQKAVLHEICDMIIKYGLEKISRKTQLPERHIVTPEMPMV